MGLCPPRTPPILRFYPICLSSKIKNLYIFPEPGNHHIAEKILYFLFLLFLVRFVKLGIMSSCSSNHMEEDAWMMNTETKSEDPTDVIKGGQGLFFITTTIFFITRGEMSIRYGHSPWLSPSLGEVPRYRIIPLSFCFYLF